jgi:hypothetical protein
MEFMERKYLKNFYASPSMTGNYSCQEKEMTNLKFVRKLSRSEDNKASVITIPRPIALAWQEHSTVDLIFDGNCLVITPADEGKQVHGDDEA